MNCYKTVTSSKSIAYKTKTYNMLNINIVTLLGCLLTYSLLLQNCYNVDNQYSIFLSV